MKTIPYILATAGHVDHGKSALVIALTGTDPDRLPEEKARGITIELGFAHLRLPSPPNVDPPVEYLVGVVDVPGHEDFVKNMVAGVGSIDAALLVVAADDGWMPQTEEHLQILTYLGVKRGVVALTKIDLKAEDESRIVASVRERLQQSPLAGAAIVATSVRSGRGIDDLKSALASLLAATPPPRDVGKPRLALDRAFSLKGLGTVVTGTLTGGTLCRGQSVIVQPGGVITRIRNVQSYHRDVETALPGTRVALNLADVEPRWAHAARGERVVGRGDVVTIAELASMSRKLDILLERSARSMVSGAVLTARQIKPGALVQVHHGTRAFPARAYWEQCSGHARVVHLSLQQEGVFFAGDRLVIRDWSEQQTLAGGIVLDTTPQRRERAIVSEPRSAAPDDLRVLIETELRRRDAMLDRSKLLTQSKFAKDEIERAADELVTSGALVNVGTMLCRAEQWGAMLAQAAQRIDEWHTSHPEQPGMPISALGADDAVVVELCNCGFERNGAMIRRVSHRPTLPPRLQEAGDAIRDRLADRPFDPPSRRELAPDSVAAEALKSLISSGEVVELGPEIVLSAGAFARAAQLVRDHIVTTGPASVSALRDLVGSSRRIMVPLLERLDRQGLTRRVGDLRELGAATPQAQAPPRRAPS